MSVESIAGTPSAEVGSAPAETCRILLVEDDSSDAVLVEQALLAGAGRDFEISWADRLRTALDRLATHQFDCALLDLTLPDCSGFETLSRMAAHAPELPIVVLTGLRDERTILAAVREGAQDYLDKRDLEGDLLWRTIQYAMDRKRTEQEFRYLARHDGLTGLTNRQGIMERLDIALTKLRRDPGYAALLFVDVDDFKLVNDSLGHAVGDELLREFARRLEGAVRSPDAVGRLGGDEFLVLLDRVPTETAALDLAARIQHLMHHAFVIDGSELRISASIGLSLSNDPAIPAQELVRQADTALYRAKRAGSGRTEVFDGDMQDRAQDRLRLKGQLHEALERDEFELHFQPIVDLGTRDVVGVEALARWRNGDRLVMPDDFIGLAEDTGLIRPIGDAVFELACRRAVAQPSGGLLTVNVSGRQLASPTFAASLSRTLDRTGADPARLGLEVTETALMFDEEASLTRLQQIQSLGLRLLIDDFGTGFSSLSYLHRYPFDAIKIDLSFVQGLTEADDASAAIVSAIVGLGTSLGLKVIAEGIETEDQLQRLVALGCQQGQGFFLGRPVPDPHTRPPGDSPGATARHPRPRSTP